MTPRCPLCGEDRSAPAFEKGGRQYRRCGACTLLFARGDGNANLRDSIQDYEPAYRQYLDDSPVDAANLDDVIARIESHIPLRNPAIRLVDVGAGSGKLIRRLRQIRSCEVSGIEPSAPLCQTYGLGSLGVERMTLPELASRAAAVYDVVTVLDVIEHVPDASEFVHALGQVTKPNGFVFLSTPDAGAPLARLLGRRWHHYNAYHFCLYGKHALAEAARLGGFQVIECGHQSKRMPLDYLWNFALTFLFGRPGAGLRTSGRLAVPINVHDILSAVWRRL